MFWKGKILSLFVESVFKNENNNRTELDTNDASQEELNIIKQKAFKLVDNDVEDVNDQKRIKKEIDSVVDGFKSGNIDTIRTHAELYPEDHPESFENLAYDAIDEGNREWYFIYKALNDLFTPLEFKEWLQKR